MYLVANNTSKDVQKAFQMTHTIGSQTIKGEQRKKNDEKNWNRWLTQTNPTRPSTRSLEKNLAEKRRIGRFFFSGTRVVINIDISSGPETGLIEYN